MGNCIFCKIINKEIPSKIVYEDDEIIAFNDTNPVAPIHILVVPKKHISSLVELQENDEILIGKVYSVINKIAQEQGISKNGFRVITNCGKDGGQTVPHVHFHLIAGKKLDEKIV